MTTIFDKVKEAFVEAQPDPLEFYKKRIREINKAIQQSNVPHRSKRS